MKVNALVCGILVGIFAFAASQAQADQMGELCSILNAGRNNQAALNRQIANERNPLKQSSLQQQAGQIERQTAASLNNFWRVNNNQFTNFTGTVSSFNVMQYNVGPGVMLGIALPCQYNLSFQFIEITNPAWGNFQPESQTPLSKWRPALENITVGDTVTVSGRLSTGRPLAVMTALQKRGGIAYTVPDEYLLRENAQREDESRKDKIIQGIANHLSGKWSGEWELGGLVNPIGTNKASFDLDLNENGSVLTGAYFERGGRTNVNGRVNGKQISFGYQYTDGTSRTFTGTIDATGGISGTWNQNGNSGTWKMFKKTSSSESPATAASQGQQPDPSACKVTTLYLGISRIVSPYKGGCKAGMADGQGTFSAIVEDAPGVTSVKGNFHEGRLNGYATINGPTVDVHGQYRDNRPINAKARFAIKGVQMYMEFRNGTPFVVCKSNRQDEVNCTDRERQLIPSFHTN